MELCKYRNTIRIEIFDKEIKIKPCGFIDYREEKYKNFVHTFKIENLSNNLNSEIKSVANVCSEAFNCKRNNFQLNKVELYFKTKNKKSISNILDKLINYRAILIFWEIPNKATQHFILKYIVEKRFSLKVGIIFYLRYKIRFSKLENIAIDLSVANSFIKFIFNEKIITQNLSKSNIKKLENLSKLNSIDFIYLRFKNFNKYLNKKFKNLYSFFSVLDEKLNKAKFEKILKIYSEYNFGVLKESMRGNEPFFIRYSGPKNNLDFDTFEILDPNKNLISKIKRENLSDLEKIFNKDEVINLFLDLKSDAEKQKSDYLKILKILKDYPIFEVTLGKSEILKFENFKELAYLTTKYFLIIEDLHPNLENIATMRENFDFKIYGVAQNISDWKNLQPLLEQEYIDRIIYIEYNKDDFENSKKELENYYKYMEKTPDSIYDRFYIYPDYLLKDDEITEFYKNHNEKRRPYYDTKGISMHYFLR